MYSIVALSFRVENSRAISVSGTTTDGQRIEIRGCDLWVFRDGKVIKKDSFWKIRTVE